jgi:hypothetical protein
MDDIESRLRQELKYDRRLGWWNHYAAYTVHLLAILTSFVASIVAASDVLDKFLLAIVAAIPGTLLATQNVLKFEHKCNWYYKKARLFQHTLDALKFEDWKPDKASQEVKNIEDKMDLEWPGFGTMVVRPTEGPGPSGQLVNSP